MIDGPIIYLEHTNDGKLILRVWADINQEDPTHVIDLTGAKECMLKSPCT
jgi:hypothetical protein